MHYSSMAPTSWKRALVKCLVNRCHRISSSYCGFANELDNIKTICSKNGYPPLFAQSIIDEFVKSRNISEQNYKAATNLTERANQNNNNVAYFTVPYVGKASQKLQNCVKSEMENHGLSVIASYTTTTVGSYFNLKTLCSKYFKSNIVYKFNCSQDSRVSYIGETTRQFFKRIDEHKKSDTKSAVFEHLFNCSSCQDHPNSNTQFSILKSCRRNEIYGFEALLIKKFKPSLNIQLGAGKGAKTTLSIY